MSASDGVPRSRRQPTPPEAMPKGTSEGTPEAGFASESGAKWGDRASISARWPITIFIATHLQLHLTGHGRGYNSQRTKPSAPGPSPMARSVALDGSPVRRPRTPIVRRSRFLDSQDLARWITDL